MEYPVFTARSRVRIEYAIRTTSAQFFEREIGAASDAKSLDDVLSSPAKQDALLCHFPQSRAVYSSSPLRR